MDFSDAKATFGLACIGTPTSTGASGTLQLGGYSQDTQLTEVDVAYSVRAIIVSSASYFEIVPTTGVTSTSSAFTAGTAQVETATIVAAGGCNSNGTMALVVTSAGMTGNPRTVNVVLTIAQHTTAALITTAARTALAADAVIAARFTVGGTSAAITLTRRPTNTFTVPGGTLNFYAANDTTLNLAIPTGLGVTAAASSTNTTAGVATSGCKIYDGDGKDLEGVTIPTISELRAFRITLETVDGVSESMLWEIDSASQFIQLNSGQQIQSTATQLAPLNMPTPWKFSPDSGPMDMTLTIFGTT